MFSLFHPGFFLKVSHFISLGGFNLSVFTRLFKYAVNIFIHLAFVLVVYLLFLLIVNSAQSANTRSSSYHPASSGFFFHSFLKIIAIISPARFYIFKVDRLSICIILLTLILVLVLVLVLMGAETAPPPSVSPASIE